MPSDDFAAWIIAHLSAKDWSLRKLAREAKIHHSTISRVLSGRSNPGHDFCEGIARAFNVPPKEVLQRAGLLPRDSDDDELTELALHLFRNLDERQQRDIVTMLQSLIEKRKAKEKKE